MPKVPKFIKERVLSKVPKSPTNDIHQRRNTSKASQE